MDLRDIFVKAYSNSNNIEEGIMAMKNEGATQMDSLKIIKSFFNISIREADEIILNSKSWSKDKNQSVSFREEFADFLENNNGNKSDD